jgi:hypothetical protein
MKKIAVGITICVCLADGASTKFYENGGLRACRLSRAATVRGKQFASGTRVELDEGGRIK